MRETERALLFPQGSMKIWPELAMQKKKKKRDTHTESIHHSRPLPPQHPSPSFSLCLVPAGKDSAITAPLLLFGLSCCFYLFVCACLQHGRVEPHSGMWEVKVGEEADGGGMFFLKPSSFCLCSYPSVSEKTLT